MIVHEQIPLASLTTLRAGGNARFVIECVDADEVESALAFATEHNLSWSVLGEGSNVLAHDDGYNGVIIIMRNQAITVVEREDSVLLTADAGVNWDALVREAADRNLWGLENLAGIPGTVGAAPVQNIGAYGAEIRDTLYSTEAFDTQENRVRVFNSEDCAFGYRDSRFKREPNLIILSVSFSLRRVAEPNIGYKDLVAAQEQGIDLSTPGAIGEAVRAIRARKFPDLSKVGTAGSFFKNPTISEEAYASLNERYPGMPGFPNESGVKVPLAFVLDHVLALRGYTEGNVSLFERQPLVLVTSDGATATEVDTFANGIATRVYDATGISVEREVRNFPS